MIVDLDEDAIEGYDHAGDTPSSSSRDSSKQLRSLLAHFLFRDQVRHLISRGLWPEGFAQMEGGKAAAVGAREDAHGSAEGQDDAKEQLRLPPSDSEEDDSEDDLWVNPNRRHEVEYSEEEDEEEEGEDEDEEAEVDAGKVSERNNAGEVSEEIAVMNVGQTSESR